MQIFDYKNFNVRLIDTRPKQQAIQLNIYNPNIDGHSYCTFIQTEIQTENNAGTSSELSDIFQTLSESGQLEVLLQNAQTCFSNAS
jgi:hypothetical protein